MAMEAEIHLAGNCFLFGETNGLGMRLDVDPLAGVDGHTSNSSSRLGCVSDPPSTSCSLIFQSSGID